MTESSPRRPRGRPATGRTSATISIRLPQPMIDRLKQMDSASGYVRKLIEADFSN